MAKAYTLTDTLPKDAGGAKFFGLPSISSSTTDLVLPLGIGASTYEFNSSRVFAYQGIATTIAGSPVTNAIAGVTQMVTFTANASNVAVNNSIPRRGDDRGQAYVTSLSATTSLMSGSTETFTVASGVLLKVFCAGCGVVAGGQVSILNGGTSLCHFVFSGNNETLPQFDLGNTGACFGSLRYERRNVGAAVYVTAHYKTWGQG